MAALDDRDVAEASVAHDAKGFDRRGVRRDRHGMRGHRLRERRGAALALCQQPERVAAREDADKVLVLVHDERGPHALLAHGLAGLLHACRRRHEQRLLIPDDVAKSAIDHGAFLRSTFLIVVAADGPAAESKP